MIGEGPEAKIKYSCYACGYIGPETGAKEYCQACGEDFPPPGSNGETIPCKCGCNIYDDSCPTCGAHEEFGEWENDPRSRS